MEAISRVVYSQDPPGSYPAWCAPQHLQVPALASAHPLSVAVGWKPQTIPLVTAQNGRSFLLSCAFNSQLDRGSVVPHLIPENLTQIFHKLCGKCFPTPMASPFFLCRPSAASPRCPSPAAAAPQRHRTCRGPAPGLAAHRRS